MSEMIVLTLLMTGCGDRAADSGDVAEARPEWCADAMTVTYDNFGEGFLLTHCAGCHASTAPNRFGAPEEVSFDTEEEARVWKDRIYAAVFTNETMPPAGGVTEDELTLAEIWIECDL